MATLDFEQRVEDRPALLVLVVPIGAVNQQIFNKMYEKISRIRLLPPQDSYGSRYLRYVRTYTPNSNDWASFQLHRGIRGIIGVSVVNNDASPATVDLAALNIEFENVKSLYKSSLYDARLLVFGLEYTPKASFVTRPSVAAQENGAVAISNSDSKQSLNITDNNILVSTKERASTVSEISTNSSIVAPGAVIAYSSADQCDDLEERLLEFAASMFWILESKRVSGLQERLDRLQCAYAPCEKKDADSLDSSGEGRSFKRRCQGRQRKQLADMCLLCGLNEEAMVHYSSAADLLKQVNDWLWYAAALEGIAITTVLIVFQHQKDQRRGSIPRNLSFTNRRDSEISNRSFKGRNSIKGQLHRSNIGLEDIKTLLPDPSKLFELFVDAVENYGKFRDAAVVNLECNMKASRAMIRLGEFKYATDLLQNFVTFEIALSDEQKVQRYLTASSFYAKMGMMRKYSFFRRIAAMNCITAGCSITSWIQCYHILLESLAGYNISLDNRSLTAVSPGWSDLQMRVFYELAYTARRINNQSIAVRHLCFLLHIWHEHLSVDELKMMLEALQAYTGQVEVLPQPLALDSGQILMPVHFVHFPKIISITPQMLPTHLRPLKNTDSNPKTAREPMSIFIYSPLQQQDDAANKLRAQEVVWAAEEKCRVVLHMTNPLMTELEVNDLTLVSEGVPVDHQQPIKVTLPPKSLTAQVIEMVFIPREAGKLRITGLSHKCFGVRSNCKLQDVLSVPHIEVDVIATLPAIDVSTSRTSVIQANSNDNDVLTGSSVNEQHTVSCVQADVFVGTREHFTVTVTNISKVAVEHVTIETSVPHDMLTWDPGAIQCQLPLLPEGVLHFDIQLTAPGSKSLMESKVTALRANDKNARETAVRGTLTFLYSGGQGHSLGYQRKQEMELQFFVKQCLILKHLSVVPSSAEGRCVIKLDLHNMSSHDVQMSASSCSIGPDAIGQVRLEVPCLEVSEHLRLSSEQDICLHLTQHCNVPWTISELNVNGIFVLDVVWPWTEDQQLVLHRRPYTLSLAIDGYPLADEKEVTCLFGKAVELTLTLSNVSSYDLVPVTYSLTCRRLDSQQLNSTTVLMSGPSVTVWDHVAHGASVSSKHSLVFLWAGLGELELSFTVGSLLKYSKTIRCIACK